MMITQKPVCVAPTADVCGEGAVWHAGSGALYWTDINRFLIHRYRPEDACVRTWYFDEPVTALILTDREDTLAVVLGSGVMIWRPQEEYDITLTVVKLEINQPLQDDKFALEQPPGAEVVRLGQNKAPGDSRGGDDH